MQKLPKTKIKMQLKKSTKMIDTDGDGEADMTEAQWYGRKDNANLLMLEVGKRYLEFYEQIKLFGSSAKMKEGGRVGYYIGGDVMPGQPMQAAGPTDQEAMPQELSGITFEELRARLPQEVGDDVVRLLANSAEALEDFAMIQTEQDINTFNKKYGVNLVLPSEG